MSTHEDRTASLASKLKRFLPNVWGRGRIAFTIPSTEYGARTGHRTMPPEGGEFGRGSMSTRTLLTGRTHPMPQDPHEPNTERTTP